jgi:hypothetical protein
MKTKIAILLFVVVVGMFSFATGAQAQECHSVLCEDAQARVMVYIQQQAHNPRSVKVVTALATTTRYGDIGVYVKYLAENGSGALVLQDNMFWVLPNGEVQVIQ